MRKSTGLHLIIIAVVLGGILGSCAGQDSGSLQTPQPQMQTSPSPAFTATLEEPKQKLLTICIGQEPATLYLYKGNSHSMWSILEAIYDGPIDIQDYQPVPVILNAIPDTANGSLAFQPVPVAAGDIVVDVDGNLAALAAGVKVFPSGCTSFKLCAHLGWSIHTDHGPYGGKFCAQGWHPMVGWTTADRR